MSSRRVDLLNIGLMLASLGAAWALPFELFLFSYAVLGPLHYLTEIAWLHHRDYFARRRRDVLWLVLPLTPVLAQQAGLIELDLGRWEPVLNTLAIGVALAVAFCATWRARSIFIGGAALVALLGFGAQGPHDILRVFLPTIIHVWLFTGAFVLLGALRGRAPTGFVSLGTFLACSVACFALPARVTTEPVSASYDAILALNVTLLEWLGAPPASRVDVLYTELGGRVARFIAFAYTYHYLNWFSKTSIIQWHRIPRAWSIANVALWLVAVGLYRHDYALGLSALFALSYLHVYLELPLNGRSFADIGRQLATLGRARVR